MNILSDIVEEAKVFVSTLGEYYLAVTRRDPSDSHIPSPSPSLVGMLKGAATETGITSVPVQIAQDVVATHAASFPLTEAPVIIVEDTAEPVAQEEVNNPPVVLSTAEATPEPQTIEPANPPEVTAPAEVNSDFTCPVVSIDP